MRSDDEQVNEIEELREQLAVANALLGRIHKWQGPHGLTVTMMNDIGGHLANQPATAVVLDSAPAQRETLPRMMNAQPTESPEERWGLFEGTELVHGMRTVLSSRDAAVREAGRISVSAGDFDADLRIARIQRNAEGKWEELDKPAAPTRTVDVRSICGVLHQFLEDRSKTTGWLVSALQDEGLFTAPARTEVEQRVLPPFEAAWDRKRREGYQYGREALEQVRFGYEIAEETLKLTRRGCSRTEVEQAVLNEIELAMRRLGDDPGYYECQAGDLDELGGDALYDAVNAFTAELARRKEKS